MRLLSSMIGSNGQSDNQAFTTFAPRALSTLKNTTSQDTTLPPIYEGKATQCHNFTSNVDANHQTLLSSPNSPSYSTYIPISEHIDFSPLPIVLPQKFTKKDKAGLLPFSRAYPTCLTHYSIDKVIFINFIDELNERYVKHQAFTAMDMAGQISRYTQEPIAMSVGAGLQVAALVGGQGVSYKRTKDFLNKSNEELFFPRGLQVKIVNTEKMMTLCRIPMQAIQLSSVAAAQNTLEIDTSSSDCILNDPARRITSALHGFVAVLDWNVKDYISTSTDGILAKFGQMDTGIQGYKQNRGRNSNNQEGRKHEEEQEEDHQEMNGKRDRSSGGRQRRRDRESDKSVRDGGRGNRQNGKRKNKSIFGGNLSDKDVFQQTKWILILPIGLDAIKVGKQENENDYDLDG